MDLLLITRNKETDPESESKIFSLYNLLIGNKVSIRVHGVDTLEIACCDKQWVILLKSG